MTFQSVLKMRKLLLPLLFVFCLAGNVQAQLNNSWIDYSKTYYKFLVPTDGLHRISQPVLSGIGLGNVPAEQFQLWRNGKQVRIYTSASTGPLGSNGYIEFLGKRNTGEEDTPLYRDPYNQLTDSFSLHNDTAAYFLTVNPAGGNLRFETAANNVNGNTLSPEPYFMRTVSHAYKEKYNRGYAAIVGEYVYSSSFEQGEGWTSNDAVPGFDLTYEFNQLNVYTAGPANSLSVYISAFGNALYTRNLRVKLFNNVVLDSQMNYFTIIKKRIDNLPLSYLQSPNYVPVYMNGTSTNPIDRIVVGEIALTYPSTFNFSLKKKYSFNLGPSSVGNYLEIESFDYGVTPPVLYSLNDGKRYEADLSVAGKIRFVLPPSTDPKRQFILMNVESSNITNVASLSVKNFVNLTQTSNQGDYLIISNSALYNDGNGVNYVDLYRQYRASVAGGSYNAKVFNIEELNDQFAFGIRKHPSAIRDFIRYADRNFTVKPKYAFIIGRGLSSLEYRENAENPVTEKLDLVQTFGWPASDVLLACEPGKNVPLFPIGRLSAVNGTEVKQYFEKVKEYEQVQATPSGAIADKAWMKNIMHIVGGADSLEDDLFNSYLNGYKAIAEDSLFGASVSTFRKASTAAVQQATGQQIEQLISDGVSVISYFGHSSANTLAFNLSSPELYNNPRKYSFFDVSGCSAGNFFIFDPTRLTGNLSISEKYVLADHRGSIGFLASTHLGIPPFLNFYNTQYYNQFAKTMYGNTIGNQIRQVLNNLGSNPAALDYYTRIHLEEINLNGDPAIKINAFAQPDFVVEDQLVRVSPSVITVADNNFNVSVKMMNIGRVVNDSMRVIVKRQLPNDTIQVLYNQVVPAIKNIDSLSFTIPINSITDKGLNKLIVSLDTDSRITESYETNNTLTKEFYIFEDEIRPVYPYNYSIVHNQNITFSASTANALGGQRQYVMEIDTTENFNSAFKKQYTTNGVGGLIQFTPGNITFTDSTVYYWRTSMVPLGTNPQIWNGSSFVYIAGSSDGFSQSHYYQHLKSTFSNTIGLDADRLYRFRQIPRNLLIRTGLYPYISYDRINVNIDFDQVEYYGCKYGSLQFLVYDSSTLQPMHNYNTAGSGRFGSWPICDPYADGSRHFFEFPYTDPVYRKKAMDFLDSIPSGSYVSITNLGWTGNTSFISEWQADASLYGAGNTLYHKLKALGFTKIDSFYKNLPFLFVYQKGMASFTPKQTMGATEEDQVEETYVLASKYKDGTIESPAFGPATAWRTLHWWPKSLPPAENDTTTVQVFGIRSNGARDLLATVTTQALDTTLAFINASVYPYLKLKMYTKDEISTTPAQLKYWRINADYVKEGAVAPNIFYSMKDTVDQGEKINFALAFKNISPVGFDSIKIKFVITDRNNAPHVISLPKAKPILQGDTVTVRYSIDTKDYPGNNTLYLMFNSDADQPEQALFNNFVYKDFYVKEDKFNPLLDVTFDGVHILNRDIVASKPEIMVKLKDESRFMALSDTALLKVQVRYPDGTLHNYFFGPEMIFTPANLTSGQNTATIEFKPYFPDDGEYELIVSGKDVVGNRAGNLEYRVTFTVINKPMISNMLNYPNPFTTSTAFVFTVTGSEVPQNIRIQIMTITGKVVREITKAELGPIHIGRNITEFKWDGTDSYGQKLGNGVYLYRVITNLDGKSLDKYKADGDRTDKYFNKGYGKMYLMR